MSRTCVLEVPLPLLSHHNRIKNYQTRITNLDTRLEFKNNELNFAKSKLRYEFEYFEVD